MMRKEGCKYVSLLIIFSLIHPLTDTLCRVNLTSSSEIHTPNYPYYYGGGLHCLWTIVAPRGRYAALNITFVQLAPPVQIIKVT